MKVERDEATRALTLCGKTMRGLQDDLHKLMAERDEWKRRAEQIWQDLDRTITGEWPANASARTWFPEAAEWFEEP